MKKLFYILLLFSGILSGTLCRAEEASKHYPDEYKINPEPMEVKGNFAICKGIAFKLDEEPDDLSCTLVRCDFNLDGKMDYMVIYDYRGLNLMMFARDLYFWVSGEKESYVRTKLFSFGGAICKDKYGFYLRNTLNTRPYQLGTVDKTFWQDKIFRFQKDGTLLQTCAEQTPPAPAAK